MFKVGNTYATRNGGSVRIESVTANPHHLTGQEYRFPILGVFITPGGDSHRRGIGPSERRYWRADGGFAFNGQDPFDIIFTDTAELTQPQPSSTPGPEQEQPMNQHHIPFAVAMLTTVQARIINQAREAAPGKKDAGSEDRKQIKREVYAVAKAKFGIPASTPVKCNTTGVDQKGYLILHDKQGRAFQLGDTGKWTGTMLTQDQLFPKPVEPVAPAAEPVLSTSVFGGSPLGKWFRLDAGAVAAALTTEDLAELMDNGPSDADAGADALHEAGRVPMSTEGGNLPTPHLMLAGRTDLAITQDGSIYRKM